VAGSFSRNTLGDAMTYAVLQTGQNSPSIEQLESALQQVPGVTAMDAQILRRDAHGVLVKGFELGRASAMKLALAAQGIEAEVVEDKTLAELPQAMQLNKVGFSPEAFLIYDLVGRSIPLDWNNISVIAAGRARMTEFTTEPATRFAASPAKENDTRLASARQTKEEQKDHLLLEIITRGATHRYNTVADRPETIFLFQSLGERRCNEPLLNLAMFVQELAKFAPAAALNYGAYQLCENRDATFTYRSKTAFYREITWLLWMLSTGRMPQ
jgi:hypothetical protein